MKSFEPRSMMQEHPRNSSSEPARGERRYSWTVPAHTILNYFEKIVAPPFE
jgi:hypothetical protein